MFPFRRSLARSFLVFGLIVSLGRCAFAGVGAAVPWVRYEAEDGARSGGASLLGPNRTAGDPAGEASGRKAVRLSGTGDYIEWPVTSTATALVIRLSIPDAPAGGGIDATLGLYKAGARVQSIPVTSKYAWVYGPDNGTFDDSTLNNTPSHGAPHRIYDESSVLLTTTFQPGDTIRIQKGAEDTAAYYDVDLIELENPVEVAQPANSISIVSKGATANDDTDDADAIVAAIAEAKSTGKSVWIPRGVFKTRRQIAVFGVTLQGAGMWFSEIDYAGTTASDLGAFSVTASNTTLKDFRIMGSETFRTSNFRGILGPFGSNSEVDNVWIEHTTAGIWVGIQGSTIPPTNLRFSGCRIRNTFADGIDLQNGALNCTIENCTTRNTGDDALVIWSLQSTNTRACTGNTIRNCTTECTWFGGGMALYGGANTLESNYIADTFCGPGLKIEQEFTSFPFSATTTIHNNTLARCGGQFFNAQEFPTIAVVAFDGDIPAAVTLQDTTITDSTFTAVQFQCVSGHRMTGAITFDGLTVDGAKQLFWVQGAAVGSATVARITARNLVQAAPVKSDTTAFTLNGLPQVVTPPSSQIVSAAGRSLSLSATAATVGTTTYQWFKNGGAVAGATATSITVPNFQPSDTGIYTMNAYASGQSGSSAGAIVGLASNAVVIGSGYVFQANVPHPNGNIFNQVLITGAAETITAEPGKVTRTSFVDLNDDIVQVEFAGAGTLSLVLDGFSGPALAINYEQPTVSYMKGNAQIVIIGADETTNVSIFTVGRATAFDPSGNYNFLLPISATNDPATNRNSIFTGHETTNYDGVADVAFVAISSTNGKFGGLRAADASFFATLGYTGVYAPGVEFTGPVNLGDINASGTAIPVLKIGSADAGVRITGGDLKQGNGQPVQIGGFTQLLMTAGVTSANKSLPAQTSLGRLVDAAGTDVTAAVIVNPTP